MADNAKNQFGQVGKKNYKGEGTWRLDPLQTIVDVHKIGAMPPITYYIIEAGSLTGPEGGDSGGWTGVAAWRNAPTNGKLPFPGETNIPRTGCKPWASGWSIQLPAYQTTNPTSDGLDFKSIGTSDFPLGIGGGEFYMSDPGAEGEYVNFAPVSSVVFDHEFKGSGFTVREPDVTGTPFTYAGTNMEMKTGLRAVHQIGKLNGALRDTIIIDMRQLSQDCPSASAKKSKVTGKYPLESFISWTLWWNCAGAGPQHGFTIKGYRDKDDGTQGKFLSPKNTRLKEQKSATTYDGELVYQGYFAWCELGVFLWPSVTFAIPLTTGSDGGSDGAGIVSFDYQWYYPEFPPFQSPFKFDSPKPKKGKSILEQNFTPSQWKYKKSITNPK